MKFSILTPVHIWNEERRDQLFRAIESVKKQTFQDYEHIIVNDGSTLEVEIPKDDKTLVLNQPHLERVVAYNLAMENAKGEWFVCLDSDDELDPQYLEKFNEAIEANPEFKLFNCGSRYVHKNGSISVRGPFRPPEREVGHEEFGGANIVNGTFVWHRSLYDEMGGFPPAKVENVDCTEINYGGVRDLYMTSPWDFSAMAQIEFPELRKHYFIDRENEPDKAIKELGNPWGQDHYLFYKYTRKYRTFPFEDNLYIVHPR